MDVLNEQGKFIERDITLPSGEVIHVVAGENQHVLDGGAVYDDIKKQIAHGPPKGGTYAITVDNREDKRASYYQDRAAEIMRDALASKDRQSGSVRVKSWEGGALAISERLVNSALNDSRDGNDAAKVVFSVAQMLPDRRQSNNVDPNGVQINLGSDIVSQIIQIMAEKRQKE
jgi:hypothetical protein